VMIGGKSYWSNGVSRLKGLEEAGGWRLEAGGWRLDKAINPGKRGKGLMASAYLVQRPYSFTNH